MPLNNIYNITTRGAMTFTGNTLGLSQLANTNNAGTVGSIGAFINAHTTTAANPTWPGGTTLLFAQNYSEAVVSVLPSGASVLKAQLVWGGLYRSVGQNIQASLTNSVQFTTPLGTTAVAPDPAQAQTQTIVAGATTTGMYTNSRDVTALVKAAGNGTYGCGAVPGLVDPVQANTNATNCCGWTLCIVYSNLSAPLRNMTLFSGLTIISTAINPFTDIPISGFSTPFTGPVSARVLFSAQEGDADIQGDNALIGPNTGALSTLSGPNNFVNNFFSSQINNDSGNLDTTGTFGTRNQNAATRTNIIGGRQGWDITNVDASAGFTNAQTSAVIRLTTAQDTYIANAVGIQVDINQASFNQTYKSVSTNYATIGDTITYTFVVNNTSVTNGDQVVLVDTLPNGVTFIPNTVTINGAAAPGAAPIPGINLGSIPAGSVKTVTFQVVVTSSIPSPNPMPDNAELDYSYIPAPGLPVQTGNLVSNTVNTLVNTSNVTEKKTVDKSYADVGNTLTYTIVLTNTGTTTANSVVFKDTIPSGTTYVAGSFTQNGATVGGANPQTGVTLNNIGPNQRVTITFQVVVATVPTPNPILNQATTSWQYTVDPSIPRVLAGNTSSNQAPTQVNHVNLTPTTKTVDKSNANVGDTLTYSIALTNQGNTTATNIIFKDTIPQGTTFIPNSVTVNGVGVPGTVAPPTGVNIGTLGAGRTETITFQVVVNTIPTPNPIPNAGNFAYNYLIDPTLGTTGSGNTNTNTAITKINTAIVSTSKAVDKNFADVGDTVTYTIVMKNLGTTTATPVIFQDTIPNDTTYVAGSFTQNGAAVPGANPQAGVTLNDMGPGQVTTVTFQVVINTIPTPNPIPNSGTLNYNYIIDPSIGRTGSGGIGTNKVNTLVNTVILTTLKGVDMNYADVGNTLTYTVAITNSGTTTASPVVFQDTIPSGTAYVAGSFTQNGVAVPGANPQTGVTLAPLGPGQVVTVSFQVSVTTVPTPNPIPNDSTTTWKYIVDPTLGTTKSGGNPSNEVTTLVNHIDLPINKVVDKSFAQIGDTLTYSIGVTNKGNTTANTIQFIDTIPNGTTFVPNSVAIDGVNQPGTVVAPPTGLAIAPLGAGQTTTVTFQVIVNTLPNPNPIPNSANTTFNYIVDPTLGTTSSGASNTNIVDTQVNQAILDSNKAVNLNFADIGNTLTYTVGIMNQGTITATTLVFQDTIPNGTTYVPGSFTQNGVAVPGANPQTGVSLNPVGPGQVVTVSFQVVVNTIPTPNPIPNDSTTMWQYVVDPAQPPQNGSDTSNEVTTQINHVDLAPVNKSVDKEFAQIGDTITYTVGITNSGNTDANNIVLIDTVPIGTAFVINSVSIDGVPQTGAVVYPPTGLSIATLPAGTTTTITFQVMVETIPVPNPIPNSGNLRFNYIVDPTLGITANGGNNTNTVLTQVNTARILSGKGVKPANALVGDTITYTAVVKNTGNTPANNVTFTDPIPNGTTFVNNSLTVNGAVQPGVNPSSGVPLGTLGINQVATITFQVVIVTTPNPNPIPNTGVTQYSYTVDPTLGIITTTTTPTNTVTTYVSPNTNPLKVVSTRSASVGETITYTLYWKNVLNVTETDVVFIDTIPNDTTFVPNSITINGVPQPGSTITPPGGLPIGDVVPGQTISVTFQVVVDTLPVPNPIPNETDLGYSYISDPTVGTITTLTVPSNTVNTEVNLATISVISKSVDKNYAVIGETLTYTVFMQNTGNVTALNVVLIDTIPSGTLFIPNSVSINGVNQPGGVVYPPTGLAVPDLPAGEGVTITFEVMVNTIPVPNPIPNTGTVGLNYVKNSNTGQLQPSGANTNTVLTQVNDATISIVKAANPLYGIVGDTITYTITLNYRGNTTADNIVVVDSIPSTVDFVPGSVVFNGIAVPGADLAPPSGYNFGNLSTPGIYTITFEAVINTIPNPNPILNNATANFTFTSDPSLPDGQVRVDGSNTVATTVSMPRITITKDVSQIYADCGTTLTYTIGVTNTGSVAATQMNFVDTIPNGTVLIPNSVTVDGITQPGANPQTGLNLGNIAVGQTVTVAFQAIIVC